jgi:membrane protein
MWTSTLQKLGPVSVVRQAIQEFISHDMLSYAAALSFYALFSLLPFTFFLLALLGFLDLSDLFDAFRERAETFFSDDTMQQMNLILDQLQHRRPGLLSFGAIIALWASSSLARATMRALNKVHGVKETRPPWKRYPISILCTLGAGSMLAIAAALMLIGPKTLQWLIENLSMDESLVLIWTWWLRWPLILLLLTLAVAIVYDVAPDVQQPFRLVSLGAFLAVIAWMAASLLFRYYVYRFSHYNAMYGGIGTVIVLFLYFFISSIVLLFGAEVNFVLEHQVPIRKMPEGKTLA